MAGPRSGKVESFRLAEEDVAWIDEWIRESGQDRTAVLRAAVRLLRIITAKTEFSDRVRLIANLNRLEVYPAPMRISGVDAGTIMRPLRALMARVLVGDLLQSLQEESSNTEFGASIHLVMHPSEQLRHNDLQDGWEAAWSKIAPSKNTLHRALKAFMDSLPDEVWGIMTREGFGGRDLSTLDTSGNRAEESDSATSDVEKRPSQAPGSKRSRKKSETG